MILCCGEALVDMIPEPTVSGASGFVPHSGGSVYNTAIALGRLGVPTGMLTGLSNDMFGQQLRAGLDAAGVDSTHVITSHRATTLAFVHLTEGQAQYDFFDENSAGRMLTPEDLPDLSEGVTTLFFGGISLACEPGADAYAALLEREGTNRTVILDPNIRKGFIEDEDRYRARLEQMISAADVVKVSDEDLDWLILGAEDVAEKARALLKTGPAIVIVTRGSAGALAFQSNGTIIETPSQMVEVVDSVGAGDTFNAGFLATLHECGALNKGDVRILPRSTVEKALEFGSRVAAITVSRAGANPPWSDEL